MMKTYEISDIEAEDYSILISLLDYRQGILEQLSSINITRSKNKMVLVDTALVSGMNEYRFIDLPVIEDGTLDLANFKYVFPSQNIVNNSNKILARQKKFVKHSVLSNSQISALLSF